MASCAGLDCGQGKNVIEEAKLWAVSLKDLLASSEGRIKFKDFLIESYMEDEVHTIDFWEKCNEIVTEYQQLKKTGRSGKHDPNETSKFISKANAVIRTYVDSRIINLDEGQIESIKRCVQGEDSEIDPKNIETNFQEARGWALRLLKDVHAIYADDLIKKYRLDR